MQNMRIILAILICASAAFGRPKTVGLDGIHVGGDLHKRILRNFDRLESQRFQPLEDVGCFRESKYSWPGDMEGRTILSLALLEQAVEREAVYLDKTLHMLPERMNEKGFFGEDFFPQCDEQQLSGHGWFLRGLCELYLDGGDPDVRKMIENVVDHLVLPTAGKHTIYPIDPAERDKERGGYSGTVVADQGTWRLSSDIGCDFIFMDGVIQAAEVLGRKDLYPIIDEMVARFLEIDLVAIKAQTHATLTALRGLNRYAQLTGKDELIPEVEKRFKLYVDEASTENHMNYNWFGRPTHTEPCAFIDAFMVAVQLWQATGKTEYLEEAHQIYFNGMGHAQRANGGFGLEECSGAHDVFLEMKAPEAWWCCTMRGSEGLVRAAEYSFMRDQSTLVLPFFNSGSVEFNGGVFDVESAYPYCGKVEITVVRRPKEGTSIALFKPSWAMEAELMLDGKVIRTNEADGFLRFDGTKEQNATFVYTFSQQPRLVPTHNRNTVGNKQKVYQGPLLLAAKTKKGVPLSLPADPQFRWDQTKHCALVTGSGITLYPIDDMIDWNYEIATYQRQILWEKK
jgi:hypothetical protein